MLGRKILENSLKRIIKKGSVVKKSCFPIFKPNYLLQEWLGRDPENSSDFSLSEASYQQSLPFPTKTYICSVQKENIYKKNQILLSQAMFSM